ncbi:MAG: 3-deoxy-7-phosphoheptulonate synthase, partial [Pseudomonadales bacterium]
MSQLENLNIRAQEVLITPEQLKAKLPVPEPVQQHIEASRNSIRDILNRTDPRLLVVVGPCSIHDPEAALDYARRLRQLAGELEDSLLIVMRAYFEKPRTT